MPVSVLRDAPSSMSDRLIMKRPFANVDFAIPKRGSRLKSTLAMARRDSPSARATSCGPRQTALVAGSVSKSQMILMSVRKAH